MTKPLGWSVPPTLLFIDISPVADLDDQDNIGRLHFEHYSVVADPEPTRSSKTVPKRFPRTRRGWSLTSAQSQSESGASRSRKGQGCLAERHSPDTRSDTSLPSLVVSNAFLFLTQPVIGNPREVQVFLISKCFLNQTQSDTCDRLVAFSG